MGCENVLDWVEGCRCRLADRTAAFHHSPPKNRHSADGPVEKCLKNDPSGAKSISDSIGHGLGTAERVIIADRLLGAGRALLEIQHGKKRCQCTHFVIRERGGEGLARCRT